MSNLRGGLIVQRDKLQVRSAPLLMTVRISPFQPTTPTHSNKCKLNRSKALRQYAIGRASRVRARVRPIQEREAATRFAIEGGSFGDSEEWSNADLESNFGPM